jgi:hypothetical protein
MPWLSIYHDSFFLFNDLMKREQDLGELVLLQKRRRRPLPHDDLDEPFSRAPWKAHRELTWFGWLWRSPAYEKLTFPRSSKRILAVSAQGQVWPALHSKNPPIRLARMESPHTCLSAVNGCSIILNKFFNIYIQRLISYSILFSTITIMIYCSDADEYLIAHKSIIKLKK